VRGCFVTGTGTGVGKTAVAAAIVAALRDRAVSVQALKPVITGLDERAHPEWPHDHELLARIAGCSPEAVALATYGPPVSPHLAERLAGRRIDPSVLRGAIRDAGSRADALVVEGVGGLLVPLTDGYSVCDLVREVSLPLVVAASPGLGTINHTLLTLEAARTRGLAIAGVVLTPWPAAPGAVELSNRETISRLGDVAVALLPYIGRATPELFCEAGRLLPIDEWFGWISGGPRHPVRTATRSAMRSGPRPQPHG
jgi:dethiobiotin synthetase